LKDLPKEKRGEVGREANLIKKFLEEKIENQKIELKEINEKERESNNLIDITVPGKKIETGHLHPLTLIRQEVQEIFESMGFSIIEGPHIENEWYNFDALNVPKEHPSRDLWDTFWLKEKQKNQKLLLRTHTSPVQVRYMEKNNPPFRIIVPGRVFRHEASDASHDMQFYQIEGLMVDKKISVADFKGVTNEFLKRFFNLALLRIFIIRINSIKFGFSLLLKVL
jgi:phenylalanyl-tRNA synthetase alpha chain